MEPFLAVYPFLAPMSDSFTYSSLMVIFLSILHLNDVPGYVLGKHFLFLTVALRGLVSSDFSASSRRSRPPQLPTPYAAAATQKIYKGVYGLRNHNLTCVPSPRQLRRATGTPFRIEDFVTISSEAPAVNCAVDTGMSQFRTFRARKTRL